MIDYNDPEVVSRQNIAPNASCDIDGVFYDIRNCVYELATLRAENERLRELLCKAAGELAENSCNAPLIDTIVRELNYTKEALK